MNGGRQIPLDGLFIATKRYSLSRSDGTFADFKESGLGALLPPAGNWIEEAWRALGQMWDGRAVTPRPWFRLPAVRQLAISSPAHARELKGFPDLRPWNSFLVARAIGRKAGEAVPRIAPAVASFESDPERWPALPWAFETGVPVPLIRPDDEDVTWRLRTFYDFLLSYAQHRIAEMLAPDGSPCGPFTRGVLQRRPVRDGKPWIVLKEAAVYGDRARDAFSVSRPEIVTQPNAADDDAWNIVLKPALAIVGPPAVARNMGLAPRTARAWIAGARQPENINEVAQAIVAVADDAGLGLAVDEHLTTAEICAELPGRAAAAQCLIAMIVTMFARRFGGVRALARAMAGEDQTNLEPSLRRWGGLARNTLRPIDDLNVVVARLAAFSRAELRKLGRRVVCQPGPTGDRQVLVAYLSLLCGADRPAIISPGEALALPIFIVIACVLATLTHVVEASTRSAQRP